MKKILLTIIVLFCSIVLFAQKDVTQFLGIPVDGYKHDVIDKLKAKGFVSSSYDREILEGEFNGTDVTVYVVTNNNKVYRIMLADQTPVDETSIKIRFNKLCSQFENNPKYIPRDEEQTIPYDEDISYEMLVNNKRYQAVFYQSLADGVVDSVKIVNEYKSKLLEKYTEEELENPTEEIEEDISQITFTYMLDLLDECTKKTVWFIISETYGKYYIAMYYDNVYNQANGEDL
ncbi:MAG: hypothetical protein IJZ87_02025 [Bacteroidales bacterium]|nr:hypothetical protein [Bacteroidales bacterium]